jgi:predicted GNAT family acetyltransferase
MYKIRLATTKDTPETARMAMACQCENMPRPSAQIFCAELNGKIVGMAAVHVVNQSSMEITHIFVEQEHRNQGIGKSLMDRVVETAGPGREPINGGFIGAASSSATTHQPDDEIGVEPEPLQERRPDDVCLIGRSHHSTRFSLLEPPSD